VKVVGEEPRWLRVIEGIVMKGPRLRTRAFIPFALLLLWLATRGPLNLWGLALAALGEMLRLWASGHIHKGGEILTTSGPYAFCRNPLYLGSLLLAAGLALAVNSPWLAAALAGLFIAFHFITIAHEERRLETRYGTAYTEYRHHVPRLLPRPFPWKGRQNKGFSLACLLANREHWRALAWGLFAGIMLFLSGVTSPG